jgi:hypothetical protein
MKYRFLGYGNMLGNTDSGVVNDFEVDKIYDVRFEKGEGGNVDCYWVSLPYYGKYIDSYWDVEDFEVSFVSIEDIRSNKLDILGI